MRRLLALALVAACGSEAVVGPTSGPATGGGGSATVGQGGSAGHGGASSGGGGCAPEDEICDGIDNDCDDAIDEGIPTDGDGCQEPPAPEFPEVIDTLVVSIRTGDGQSDGTDSNTLSFCLSETACFPLNVADVDDFRIGELDVYHFEGVDLPRGAVDRVQIKSSAGSDRWVPACMEIQFDGEPVYCNGDINQPIGTDPGDVSDWTDPDGLHNACATCFASTLTHGPMVGAVHADGAELWFRTDATRKSIVRVAADSSTLNSAGPLATVYPSATDSYATHVDVKGLAPSTTYFYNVEVDGSLGDTHSFQTAPAGPSSFRFAFGSCTRHDAQPIFAQVESLEPDLFMFVGDSHYGNTADLDSLRWYYRWGLERPQRAALFRNTPTLAVWDDHDFTGNNTHGDAPGKDVALRVFNEFWANPAGGTADTPGIFHRYAYGDVEFFMLDDRYYRSLDGNLLGDAQTAWLEEQLKASSATFKFLVSGSQWTLEGSSDSWAAFPSAQQALLDFLATEQITGVVLMSGDVHRSEFRTVPRSEAYDLPELTSSPMANTNSSCGSDGDIVACFDDDDFFVSVDVDTTGDPSVHAHIIDSDGETRASWLIELSDLQ